MKPLTFVIISAWLLGASAFVQAQSPAPFPDFKAKTVTPPKPGQKKLITIQVETQVPEKKQPAAEENETSASTPPETAAWFWDRVSPSMDDARGQARLEPALLALAAAPDGQGYAPRLQVLARIAAERGVDMLLGTVGTEVSPALALAVISVESSGNPDAVSKAGAEGLMQLMPATARRYGVLDSFDPAQNIKGGVAFLDHLMDEFENDPVLALAAYNAGPNAVREHGGVPPYPETRAYVPKVFAAYQIARGLCKTPPVLISDGCVFIRPDG